MLREDVYAAFFALAAPLGSSGFTTLSRRLVLVETFAPEAFPALFQQEVGEQSAVYTQSGVQFWIFECSWYLYAYQPNETAPMTPGLNAMIDQVAQIFSDNESCFWVDDQRIAVTMNRVEIWEGVLADRAVARIDFILKPISV